MLCKDSWIDISWDGLPKRKFKENLKVNFSQKADKIMPFDVACDKAAQELYANHKNLFVALSGGCDSENVANVFYRNRIPFTPVILIYNHVVHRDQKLESWFAFQWCKKHSIEPLIVYSNDFVGSQQEKLQFLDLKPRLVYGALTTLLLIDYFKDKDVNLVTGYQLEYYPDYEQMTYLEPQLGSYVGFVLEETDWYLETLCPNRHPWGLHYWNPEVLAAFVNQWDTNLNMQENKAQIYQVAHRPKMYYPVDMIEPERMQQRSKLFSQFGTLDCALLGTKQELLAKLVK